MAIRSTSSALRVPDSDRSMSDQSCALPSARDPKTTADVTLGCLARTARIEAIASSVRPNMSVFHRLLFQEQIDLIEYDNIAPRNRLDGVLEALKVVSVAKASDPKGQTPASGMPARSSQTVASSVRPLPRCENTTAPSREPPNSRQQRRFSQIMQCMRDSSRLGEGPTQVDRSQSELRGFVGSAAGFSELTCQAL